MKVFKVSAIGLLALMCAGLLFADAPSLKGEVLIKNGGNDLKVNLYSNPFAVDWNNDGAKDLLVGQFEYGNILLYLNQGTNLNPVFNGGSKIKSNGVNIDLTYG
jgi:hypothetical protein